MAKFLYEARYVGEGIKGLIKEGGSNRVAAIEKGAQSVGGKVDAVYYAFGDVDVYVVIDFPDNAAAAAFALTINATGNVVLKTVVLMMPEELDIAVKKSPSYRAPGK